MSKKTKVEETGSRKLSDEVKRLTGEIFLDRLKEGVIKEEKLSGEIAGAQSSFILFTDNSTGESYIVILPKVPPSALNLEASVILRHYLYEPEYSHDNLIEFVPFKKQGIFIEELIKYNEAAKKWHESWSFEALREYLSAGFCIASDSKMEQYANWFYNIACAKKSSGVSLMKIFSDTEDPAACRKLLQPFAQFIFQKVVAAVLHIHALQYNHTDISSGNILFDQETKQVKLIDINAARPYDEKGMIIFSRDNTSVEGTLLCIPPEVLTRDLKADVTVAAAGMDAFSLGVIFYQLLAGKQNVNIFNMDEKNFKTGFLSNFLKDHYTELMKKSDDEIHAQLSLSMTKDGIEIDLTTKDLLCKLLHPNPTKRLQVHQIYSHPFFSKQIDQFNPEIFRAYKTSVKVGNSYMVNALEKIYFPHIFIEKVLRKQILPCLQELKKNRPKPQVRIFGKNALLVVRDDISKVTSLISTINEYLQSSKPRTKEWVQKIAEAIASAGETESGRLASPSQLKMREFSQLIAPLVPQKSPASAQEFSF